MEVLYNPVSEYYDNYKFSSLPITVCSDYQDVLNKAKSVKQSCILLNKTKNTVTDKNLDINFTYDSKLEVILVLNVELKGKSTLKINGKNYTLSNIYLLDGDKNFKISSYFVEIAAENLKLINFSMQNVKCGSSDVDYICVKTSAKNFQMYNSSLNGKSNTGVFLRLDFPLNNYIKCCTFQNFSKISAANGGEMIRLATSQYENKDANCTIDQCYFNKCLGDPEIVSVKCSANTIKNCIFENNDTSKLVLRHAHNVKVNTCYFSGAGMRVYGTNHVIENIQLVNNANILLDNKSGSSYVPATNVKVNNVYYENVKTPVTNNGKNCTVTNVTKGLKIKKEDLLKSKVDPTPPEPPTPTPIPTIIPTIVDPTKTYKLNSDLSSEQVKEIIKQIPL
jgi:poly(beta-D-mannuronate) lyase